MVKGSVPFRHVRCQEWPERMPCGCGLRGGYPGDYNTHQPVTNHDIDSKSGGSKDFRAQTRLEPIFMGYKGTTPQKGH